MNLSEKKLLTAFITQRIEMGESEWYFNPGSAIAEITETLNGRVFPSVKPAFQRKPSTAIQKSETKTCPSGNFTQSHLAAKNSLKKLEESVCGCLRCQLGTTRTNFVFGDGNPDADIMFIGEAPGLEEDRQGLPFVGRAGKLLTRMIEAIKLRREDVFIGNILKCRPPKNRDPKPDEIEMCEPILIRQIEIIMPKIICALGRISGQTLLRTKSTLGALRGKFYDYHGVKLIVTYHPAALLRNPQWKHGAWEDLKLLRREYDGMEL
ncbi:uracil-DNA glycosylase [Candidatus Latescibacterota bacterium]